MTALGVFLLVLGAIVIVAEAHVPSMGVIGGAGVIALGVGAILAVGGLGGGIAVGLATAFVVAAAGIATVALTVRKGIAVRRRRVRAGPERLIGHVGVVRSWSALSGSVLVDGALWRARHTWSEDEHAELHSGDPVVVEYLDGLTLSVRRAEEWELIR
jgi:membrane-bound ClpP family serine protease